MPLVLKRVSDSSQLILRRHSTQMQRIGLIQDTKTHTHTYSN